MHALRFATGLLVPLGMAAAVTGMPAEGLTMTDQKGEFPKPPGIERLDPALDRLVPADAVIEVLAGGYDWTEGPVWVKDGGYLLCQTHFQPGTADPAVLSIIPRI
jgi:hypothetical protein